MNDSFAKGALSENVAAHATLGISPGDYIDVVQREIDRVLKQDGGNQLQ